MSLILLDTADEAAGITGTGSVTIAAPAVAGTGVVIEGAGESTIEQVFAEWIPIQPRKPVKQIRGRGRMRIKRPSIQGVGGVVRSEREELWMLGLEDEELAA